MIHDDVAPVTLPGEAPWELGEILEFLCGWIDHDRRGRDELDRSMSGDRFGAVPPPVVPVRFGRGELNAFIIHGADPPTPDDRSVVVGPDHQLVSEGALRAFAGRLSRNCSAT
ncbi:MAG: hypothetical protein ACRDZ3_14930 [Acidimicrobiia bacterium]